MPDNTDWPNAATSSDTTRSTNEHVHSSLLSVFTRPLVEPPNLKRAVKRRYIGVLTRSEAEGWISQPTDFRFYHSWDPHQRYRIGDRLPLIVVYCSSHKIISHWIVRTTGKIVKSGKSNQPRYHIDYYFIEKFGPSFKTLSLMVESYENTPYVENGEIEVFRSARENSG